MTNEQRARVREALNILEKVGAEIAESPKINTPDEAFCHGWFAACLNTAIRATREALLS